MTEGSEWLVALVLRGVECLFPEVADFVPKDF